jgi:hypothetical protein
MMQTFLRIALATALLVGMPQVCHAGLLLQLSATDLTSGQSSDSSGNLAVKSGDLLQISVSLAGLAAPGQTLESLEADLSVPDSYLSSPTTPTPGSIVPDLSGFTGGGSPIAGIYDTIFANSGTPISSNGVFYSFNVTFSSSGPVEDTISITFGDSFVSPFPGTETPPDTSSTLTLEVRSGTVPEPSTLALGLAGVVAALAYHLWSRRRSPNVRRPGGCLVSSP